MKKFTVYAYFTTMPTEYDLSEIAELHLANTLLRFEYFQDHGQ